jgi:hypothetical protein
VVGFVLAALLMTALMWIFRRAPEAARPRVPARAQTLSGAAMALGPGLQDAQKTMGVIVLALVVGGYQQGFEVPWWVILLAAGALSADGWRIMQALGRRIIALDPHRGFAAEVTASARCPTPSPSRSPRRFRRHRRSRRRSSGSAPPSGSRPCGGGRGQHPGGVGAHDPDGGAGGRARVLGAARRDRLTPRMSPWSRPIRYRPPG